MMDVFWLEQTEADMPAENDWLSASEAVRLSTLRFAKRRADWRLGRWTAKRALAAYLHLPGHPQTLAGIQIRPASSGAPEVFVENKPGSVTISLSHRGGTAACAVSQSGAALGCDLEAIEPRSDTFVADYFTTEEQALVAQAPDADRSRLLTLLWSGKESALKALHSGLRLDTRCVAVSPLDAPRREEERSLRDSTPAVRSAYSLNSWHPLHVRYANDQIFHGWWQQTGDLVRTLVAAPPPVRPILLQIAT
jgi:4'-phosphopantetheinyl transferase